MKLIEPKSIFLTDESLFGGEEREKQARKNVRREIEQLQTRAKQLIND